MQEARRFLRRVHHLELAHVEGIHLRQVDAAALFHVAHHGFGFFLGGMVAGELLAQARVGGAAIDFRHQVHQKFRLRAVVRRVAVDFEKAQQAVDQVVDRGREVGTFLLGASPAAQVQTVVLVFLQRRGIENADHVIVHAHGFHPLMPLAGGAPVERVHILQDGEHALFRQALAQHSAEDVRARGATRQTAP